MEIELFDRRVTARPVLGPFAAAASAHAGRELRLARVEPPECAGGSHRVSIVSEASVEDVARRGGREALDPRRFRMLVEVEGCGPYEEDRWSGRRVSLGEAVVRVGESIPRCVVTTLDPDSGRRDFRTLEVLAQHRKREGGLMLGVYGDVEVPGWVRVGDAVEPVE
ncbi:MAG: MOSC domain-containing protein [Actinomycetota bacterium]|nr:MOSC domain-containing protein [Actinomycetota bacterium]